MNTSQTYNGFQVHIAQPVIYKTKVARSWKERLFTLPFKPFTRERTVTKYSEVVGDGQVIKTNNRLIMTAKTWKNLSEHLNSQG